MFNKNILIINHNKSIKILIKELMAKKQRETESIPREIKRNIQKDGKIQREKERETQGDRERHRRKTRNWQRKKMRWIEKSRERQREERVKKNIGEGERVVAYG